jgi:hypothetical protein
MEVSWLLVIGIPQFVIGKFRSHHKLLVNGKSVNIGYWKSLTTKMVNGITFF